MHIAFLTPEFPHKNLNHSAGLGTSIYNMALSLVDNNVEVSVFVYAQKETKQFEFKGIKIYAIAQKKYPFLGWFLYRKFLNRYISSKIKTTKIDLLEVPDWTGISAFMRFSIPIVMRIHGSDAYFCHLEKRTQKRKNFYFENKAIHTTDAIVAVSNFSENLTTQIFNLTTKIAVITNGINLQNFKNNFPENFKKNTILYYGTIIRKKGVLELASIMNKVIEKNPEATLILIGSDANDIATKKKSTYKLMQNLFSDKAKQNVNYIGKVSYNELQKHIQNAHICVFPSLAESFGMVTVEAMAMQKPIVNSNYGWAKELIENNVDGILENPKNHDKFAEAIIDLLKNTSKSQKIAKKALENVQKRFDIDTLVEQNIKFYKKTLAN